MKRYDMDGNEVRLGKLCKDEPEWAANRIEALEAEVTELKAYQEKLLCENEIHEQCIANIIDTKPGGSIEGQMIAATQACVRAEQRNEELEAELAQATHMAALWKRCAKSNYIAFNFTENEFFESIESECKAEAALAALKKDARELAELCNKFAAYPWANEPMMLSPETLEIINSILEATKEADNG